MSTFSDKQKLVNTRPTDGSLTQGRIYTVVSSYDGNSGSGAQEWVRVTNDRGHITGYDPARFVPYVGDQETACALACAMNVRQVLEKLGQGLQGPLFAEARRRVEEAFRDVDSIIGVVAERPYPEQIGIGELPSTERPKRLEPGTNIYQVVILGITVGWIVRRGPAKSAVAPHDGRWDLFVEEDLWDIGVDHWEDAYKAAREMIVQTAAKQGYQNIDVWAKQRRFQPTLARLIIALEEQTENA